MSERLRILIVDDDIEVCRALARVLSADGHLVDVAMDADAAIDHIYRVSRARTPYHVGFFDWHLGGGLSGVDLARIAPANMAKYLITGHAMEEIVGEWLNPLANFLRPFQKPIEMEEIRRELAKVERSLEDTPPSGHFRVSPGK